MEIYGTFEKLSPVLENVELDLSSEYYCSVDDTAVGYYYKIPWSFIKTYLQKDKQYVYELKYEYNGDTYYNDIYATYGGLTEGDIIQNSIKEQTKVMEEYYKRQEEILKKQQEAMEQQHETSKEQLETSKGIWGTLKEVLSYINPFSENFFVYKLVDLLVNAIKSLFIPGDDFFSNYFSELMNWFSDRLGFLAYPLELILDILNRIVNINFTEPIIQIPDFIEPSTDERIISAQTYNLNSLLDNSIFKTCHDIYFVLVDAVIVFGLVNLLKHKLEEVFTK